MSAEVQRQDLPLYREVADRIEALIEGGTLKPGERVPAVRRLAAQLQVSVSTVLEAYRLLEDARLIEARPRSGYYVLRCSREAPRPARTETSEVAQDCADRHLVLRLLEEMGRPGLVPLGAAVPDPSLFPSARLGREMARVNREQPERCQTYAPVRGFESLRVQVARRLLDAGVSVTPDEVLITSGCTEAVTLSLRALTRPGDTVVVESPTYLGLIEAIGSLHLKALEIATHPSDGICLTDLESALATGQVSACVLGPTFGNPLGHCMSDEAKQRLVGLLDRHEVPLIEDDVYGELSHDGARPRAVKAFDANGRVLLCSSVSKTLAPGLRIGWTVAGAHRDAIELLKFGSSVATASAPQLALASFLESGGFDRHLRRLRGHHRELVQRMVGAVAEHMPEGTAVTRPAGGHVIWVELPEQADALWLYEDALAEGISIAPGPLFSPGGRYRNCFRLNCAVTWTPRVEDALRRLGGLVKAQLDG